MYHHRKNIHVLIFLLVVALSISSFINPTKASGSVPIASNVLINNGSGSSSVGQVLTGNYDFNFNTWATVGTAGFTSSSAVTPSLALDSTNTPYIAFRDGAASNRVSVKKWNGTSWVAVGASGFSAGGLVSNPVMAIAPGDTPYVAYPDPGSSSKTTVKTFNGTSWVTVGTAGFSAGAAGTPSLKIASDGTPYIAFRDGGHSNKTTVMTYNGSSWVNVGSAGFSAGTATFTSLALSSNNTPYVAYQDGGSSNYITVMTYNGSSWVNVGSAGFSAGLAGGSSQMPSLALDSIDTPYVVYQDNGTGGFASVMKYDGASWVRVGSAGFSADSISNPSLKIASDGTPYVAYRDAGNNDGATVMKYDGASWVNVGNAGFSAGAATTTQTSLALDSSNIPYVVFSDGASSNKATLMKWTNTSSLEGTSTYKWYKDGVEISGAIADTYTVQYEDQGASITFEVTPVSAGSIAGDPVASDNAVLISTAPDMVSNVSIAGTPDVGEILTGTYDFFYNPAPWETVGFWSDAFLVAPITSVSITLDPTDVPYAAYGDTGYESKATVNKFDGANWVDVGPHGFSAGTATAITITTDSFGVPYVAYRDDANGFKATVMKYDGVSSWVPVGDAGFSAFGVNTIYLAFDSSDVLYAGFSNAGAFGVMKFTGSAWESVGDLSSLSSNFVSLAIDSFDKPYILYGDSTNGEKATVLRWNGSSWVTVGDAGFSAGAVSFNSSIALDSNDIPYVAYQDGANSNKVTVMTYNGSSWVNVGSAGFSAGEADSPSIKTDSDGTPYVAYVDVGNSSKATLMKWNGSAWEAVGGVGFSTGPVEGTTLDIDSNDAPYVGFKLTNTATPYVMKYNSTSLPQGDSTFKWYLDNVEISGATSQTYTPQSSDPGHALKFEVSPISAANVYGTRVQSDEVIVNYPVPTLSSINPTEKNAGNPTFTLTVDGTNFVDGAVVRIDGNNKATTFVSDTELTAEILDSDIISPGDKSTTVFNPTPGGGESNAVILTVHPPVDGSCGSSDGHVFLSAPSDSDAHPDNLCSVGTASSVAGTGPWVWTCVGLNGGVDASCTTRNSTGSHYVCSNGLDDDSDGLIDYPADPGCTSASGDDESNPVIPPTCLSDQTLVNGVCITTSCPTGQILSNGSCADQSCQQSGTCPPPPPSHPRSCLPTQTLVNNRCVNKTCEQLGTCPPTSHPPITGDVSNTPPSQVMPPVKHSTTGNSNRIGQVLSATLTEVRNVFSSRPGDIFSKSIAAVGIIIGALGTLGVLLFATPFSLSEIFLLPARIGSLFLTAFGIKKRIWGTVYDFITKQPLDPVYLSLVDKEGREVATALTDLDGRYGFLVPPGYYKLIPQKTNYIFPSIHAGHLTRDEVYTDLYFGNYFQIKKQGQIINFNVPMDPVKFDWNEFAKRDQNLMKFYLKRDIIMLRISEWFFNIGFALAFFAIIFAPHPYNVVIFGLYVVLSILKEVGISLSKLGSITDKKKGAPLPFAIIRVFSYKLGNEVIHKVANEKGLFYCLVPNGSYYITIEKKNPDQSYTQVFKSGKIEVKRGVVKGRWEV